MKVFTIDGLVQTVTEPTRLSNELHVTVTDKAIMICDITVEVPFTSECDRCPFISQQLVSNWG